MPALPNSKLTILRPKKNSVTVRFYRIGHGDCFLLAFAAENKNKPFYVLIDCGYKPESPCILGDEDRPKKVVQNIIATTGGEIDLMIVTHEHQDHLNAINKATGFTTLKIKQTWLAWTEDPDDDVAKALRAKYKDKLYALAAARDRLKVAQDHKRVAAIEALLATEFDQDTDLAQPAGSLLGAASFGLNKKSLSFIKQAAGGNLVLLRPHEEILELPGVEGVRVFPLGPPRSAEAMRDDDPDDEASFPRLGFDLSSPDQYFKAAVEDLTNPNTDEPASPFDKRFHVPREREGKSKERDSVYDYFHYLYHGGEGSAGESSFESRQREATARDSAGTTNYSDEVEDGAAFRRIDNEWLLSAEQLALDINTYTNNTSLVLAFELSPGGKVLLFAADAQNGNWLSWGARDFKDGDKVVTARDLLGRTVLYKVGHHGSHNATRRGTMSDNTPNLSWMATSSKYAREFTAMITAVRKYAVSIGWDHPLQSIKEALHEKAEGRVLQTDTNLIDMKKPKGVSEESWERFLTRVADKTLYFDLMIDR